MATPSAITIGSGSLTGVWAVDKKVSPPPGPALKLQGVGWALRKAASLAVPTLHISISASCPDTESQYAPQKSNLSVFQVPTAGIGGISELRLLDWDEMSPLKDFVFGARQSRNHFVTGKRGVDGRVVPDFVLKTGIDDPVIGQMLRGEIAPEGSDGSGFLVEGGEAEDAGLWIHTFDYREDGAWTVEQIWGFEMIGGERFHTRRFVVADKGGNFEMGRIVFSYFGPIDG
ncbi:uncharacterized protein N7484_006317 [Penicillium longicatenatum]|uniref:uncharacterized protein n=1 Tax=Penicillium longicatenatum TaxID=1561947 RepID=UPI002547357B|nr:uncharacterized protein N7484_006317 [Penicillium longicatenatum]KAJ5643810.1 hypothetical protein N7484_006317 [Penicillium longicatenatum]